MSVLRQTKAKTEDKRGIWFLDSACSNHMTCSKDWFVNLDETYTHTVKLGNDLRLEVKGIGDIRLEVEGILQLITRVYFVPALTSNLLSMGQLQEKNLTIVIKQGKYRVYHPTRGQIVSSTMTKNRMFIVQATKRHLQTHCLKVSEVENTQVWHMRFGHCNFKSVRAMQYRQLVQGLPKMAQHTKVCEVCKLGKQQREQIPKEEPVEGHRETAANSH
jgi:hypothetical protein